MVHSGPHPTAVFFSVKDFRERSNRGLRDIYVLLRNCRNYQMKSMVRLSAVTCVVKTDDFRSKNHVVQKPILGKSCDVLS